MLVVSAAAVRVLPSAAAAKMPSAAAKPGSVRANLARVHNGRARVIGVRAALAKANPSRLRPLLPTQQWLKHCEGPDWVSKPRCQRVPPLFVCRPVLR